MCRADMDRRRNKPSWGSTSTGTTSSGCGAISRLKIESSYRIIGRKKLMKNIYWNTKKTAKKLKLNKKLTQSYKKKKNEIILV